MQEPANFLQSIYLLMYCIYLFGKARSWVRLMKSPCIFTKKTLLLLLNSNVAQSDAKNAEAEAKPTTDALRALHSPLGSL